MSEMWLDVDVAITVPVNVFPLTDDTDFKTRETAVSYNAAGMDLVWNFQTTAGVTSQTAVTPTTAGVYDWTHSGDGMYKIEIPASGGGSINNDSEGFGWFSGFATGVLPWRGPIIGFRAAGLNNILIDSVYSATRGLTGTALPAAVADAAGGLAVSDAGGLDLDALNTAAVRLTAARAQVLDDWINAGRLDAILDIIAADVVNLDGAAMRGTDSAALASVCTEGRLAELDAANIPTDLATIDTNVDQIETAVITNAAGADIAADIIAVKADTAAVLADTADMQPKIGTPAADVSADIAAVKAETATILTDTGTTLDTKLNDIQGGAFSSATDSLEAIRDRGDAAWTTGAGGTPPQLLQSTTIATLASQTSFTLTAGSADDNAYNNAIAVITDSTTSEQKAVESVSDYVGSTKTITLAADPAIFTMAVGDTIEIIAALGSAGVAPTVTQIRQEMDSNSTQLADIAADTNELQTDDIPGVIATVQNDLDTITGADGVTLATAQGLYAPSKTGDAMALTAGATSAQLVDDIFDEVVTDHIINNTMGKILKGINEGWVAAEGSVDDASATTTVFITDLTEATDSFYSDSVLVFITGALKGQGRPVAEYNGTTKAITFDEALTSAPANTDQFIILTGHVHPVSEITAHIDANSTQLAAIVSAIGGLNDVSTADVLTQVNAALDTIIAELGVAAPAATPTLRTGLMLMYMMARNRVDVDTTGTDALKVHNDAGTQIASKAITDDGSDYSEAKMT